jgi:hypothetical protein
MKPLFLLLKSMVQGYTRKDGVVVKPHSDKRVKRARPPLNDHQMVLFPAPAKKPIPPSPFKGLDPVKSTGDLFEHDAEHAKPAGVTVASKKRVKDPMDGTHTAVTLSNGKTHRIQKLNSVESMGLPGWHDIDESTHSYLADDEDGAIKRLLEKHR